MDERLRLLRVLEGAQTIGLIGSGPLEAHLEHSHAWAEAIGEAPGSFVDIGSGGGLPGLPLAFEWPTSQATLLDSHLRSTAWIAEAISDLELDGRVSVITERAEAVGRDPELRESFPLVVARGFGAPAVTAECGSPLVAVGGRLSVSEPPGGDPARWPPDRLELLGLRLVETPQIASASFVMLEKVAAVGEKWPRRVGKPNKRPLW